MGAARVPSCVGRDPRLHSPFSIANLKHRLKVIYGAAAAGRQTEMPCQSIGRNLPFLPASRILVSCSVTCVPGKISILHLHCPRQTSNRYILQNLQGVRYGRGTSRVNKIELDLDYLIKWDYIGIMCW